MKVKAKIQRWGNSLALRLPKSVAESMGVGEGSVVGLEERDGQLIVRPAHRYRLAELLAEVRPGQIHGEVSTGPARGKESW
jgi:antitoxin MazE